MLFAKISVVRKAEPTLLAQLVPQLEKWMMHPYYRIVVDAPLFVNGITLAVQVQVGDTGEV